MLSGTERCLRQLLSSGICHRLYFKFGHVCGHVAFVILFMMRLSESRLLPIMSSNNPPFAMADIVDQLDQLAEPSKPIPELPPTISESLFHNAILEYEPCEEPDCTLVSLEGAKFHTRKDLLTTASETFKDMFTASHSGDTDPRETSVELIETSHTISLLLMVMHSPP